MKAHSEWQLFVLAINDILFLRTTISRVLTSVGVKVTAFAAATKFL